MRLRLATRAASVAAMLAAPARAAEPQALATHITAVTVYADRAQVTRAAAVDLPPQPAASR